MRTGIVRACAVMAAATAITLAGGGPARAGFSDVEDELTADLDGKPIELVEVGNWYCHDFDYPAIHCFSDPKNLEEEPEVAFAAAAAGTTYLTVYEYTTYQGAFMHMSENYSMLSLIGWNDRISSYVAKNSMSGAFWTDWLYTGVRYNFCCNQQIGSLGSFNDTFSSVFHN